MNIFEVFYDSKDEEDAEPMSKYMRKLGLKNYQEIRFNVYLMSSNIKNITKSQQPIPIDLMKWDNSQTR